MSSREIAELTKKNHADVMRDIRKMLKDLEKDQSRFADIFFDAYEREQPMFSLPYDETVCLLTGYDAKARMAVIKRWKELEAQQAPKPKTRLELARENVKLIEEIEEKALQIENLSTALDTLLDWVSILKIAKHNKVNEKKFDWRKLKSTSEQLGYTIKKAESPRYGYQNLYHLAAFKACYPQYDYSIKAD